MASIAEPAAKATVCLVSSLISGSFTNAFAPRAAASPGPDSKRGPSSPSACRLRGSPLPPGAQDYARLAEILEPAPLTEPVSRDPDDAQILACALGTQADLIVSGDRDLLDLGALGNIRILTATQALPALGR